MADTSTGGIGFFGLLQIALIILKLCDVIKGSWWIVFVPTYIAAGLVFVLVAVCLILAFILKEKMKRGE